MNDGVSLEKKKRCFHINMIKDREKNKLFICIIEKFLAILLLTKQEIADRCRNISELFLRNYRMR